MSILTKPDIHKALNDGTVEIYPRPMDEHIGPNSIDLHLDHELRTYSVITPGVGVRVTDEEMAINCRNPPQTNLIVMGTNGYILRPGTLYLGRTIERTYTPNHVPYIGGRSSIGRLGIAVHCTAGFGDVGFNGTWTLEITVVHSVRIYPGLRIAQLWLHTCSSPVPEEDQYHGRYQNQIEPTPSRLTEEP